jgi:CubicO group peptidase (beta-lactamase class C family)
VYAPFTTPVYSNGGYEILGFIIEAITNTTSAKLFEKDFIGRLNMTDSSYFIPKDLSNAVMPGGPISSYFIADTGLATA